jgi:hypothetical protein
MSLPTAPLSQARVPEASGSALSAGHHYEVAVDEDTSNPMIVDVMRECVRTTGFWALPVFRASMASDSASLRSRGDWARTVDALFVGFLSCFIASKS